MMRTPHSAVHLALLLLAHVPPPGVCDVAGGAGSINSLPGGTSSRLLPTFDTSTPRNVTALVGKSAYLSCRVRNLGNRTKGIKAEQSVKKGSLASVRELEVSPKGLIPGQCGPGILQASTYT